MQSKIENQESKVLDWEVIPPEEKKRATTLEQLFKWIAVVMDGLMRIPGSKRRLGLNPLIDFIPVVGDVSAAFVSASALLYAVRGGLPKILLARMGLNILINELVGAVPVIGSAFAFWFRPSQRNYDLFKSHVQTPLRPTKSDWVFVIAIIVILFLIIFGGFVTSILILQQLAKFLGLR